MRKLVFLGNCQGFRFKEIHAESYAEALGDQVAFVPSFNEPSDEARRLLGEADVVALQLFDQPQAAGLHNLQTPAEIVRFPTITGMFLWPTGGVQHPANKPEAYLPAGPFDANMGDSLLNRKLGAEPPSRETIQRIADEYLATDLARVAHAARKYELIIDRQKQRDAASGFGCAGIIEQGLQHDWLFPTPAVFNMTLFRHMATTLYDRLGVPRGCLTESLDAMVRPPFPTIERPIHPDVARCFGLTYIRPDQTYTFWTGERLPIREYVLRYLRYFWNAPLLSAIVGAEQVGAEQAGAEAGPSRLAAVAAVLAESLAAPHPSGRAARALSDMRWRLGDRDGALRAYARAMAIEPDDAHATGHYSFLLIQQGRPDDAAAVLQGAVRRWPGLASLWERLAHLLFGQGRLDDAIAVLARAIEQLPRDQGLVLMHRELSARRAAASA